MKTIGIDLGSSSVKVSLMDVDTGRCLASVARPRGEMPIISLQNGYAEQEPQEWWEHLGEALREIGSAHDLSDVGAVGISHQMHGLVCVGRKGEVLRRAIIWCDGRAVSYGERAFAGIGEQYCLDRLLNSPGNFTASRMAWLKEYEPDVFKATYKFLVPGDYILYKLTGEISTNDAGLSEQMLWDYPGRCRADFVLDWFGIPADKIPDNYNYSIGIQGRTDCETERLTGIPQGTPVSYRVGDQPNNAFSLGILNPGEIAATGGTSGVLCAVSDRMLSEPRSRVNTFLHANNTPETPRHTTLVCVTAAGILNAWSRRLMAPELTYEQINELCSTASPGSEGLIVLPFGNGAERLLDNRNPGASLNGINLNMHTRAHVLRAVQEGVAYNFLYGMEILEGLGIEPRTIRAGLANLFLSPVFRTTLATLLGTEIELCNTDGALGAARGAALGAGLYKDMDETLGQLRVEKVVSPCAADKAVLQDGYSRWKEEVLLRLGGN